MLRSLATIPISLTDARKFTERHHSHLHRPEGGLFASAVAEEGRLCCVAILSRPVSRILQESPTTGEVSRVASDGTAEHAASMCLGAITRAATALGYRRLVSYTLLGEAGTIYKACGWWPAALTGGGEWERDDRPRDAAPQPGAKVRWEFGPGCVSCDIEARRVYLDSIGKIDLRPRSDTFPLFGGAKHD